MSRASPLSMGVSRPARGRGLPGARAAGKPPLPNCNGFALLELLVVISIMGLLVAVLLPALEKARESARQAMCMSNQRQVLTSLHTYAADFDGHYLPGDYSLRALPNWVKDSDVDFVSP